MLPQPLQSSTAYSSTGIRGLLLLTYCAVLGYAVPTKVSEIDSARAYRVGTG